jgi:membrane associated rhomboid family serine protease
VSQSQEPQNEGPEADDEVAPTPFDNPFFLPVILIGFAIWFIYDGWFNPNMEWIKFNRVGAAITGVLGAYTTWRALRERSRQRAGE